LTAELLPDPAGEFAQQAHSRLAACRQEPIERWEPRAQLLPVFVGQETTAAASSAAAREIALRRVEAEARRTCEAFLNSNAYRLQGSRLRDEGWVCEKASGGWRCGFDGQVACEIEERSTSTREVCS
jgi:hypothetical protein